MVPLRAPRFSSSEGCSRESGQRAYFQAVCVESARLALATDASQIICIVYVVPLEKRPVLQGLFGAIFGVAAIVGPLVGGAFTSHVTWRWCFYINLPVGAVASVVIWTCLRVPDLQIARVPWTEKLWQLDLPGTVVLIGSMVCLVLALQWGGQDYKVRRRLLFYFGMFC